MGHAPARWWLDERPPDELRAGGVVLHRYRPQEAAALAAAVNESLGHLRPSMAWAAQAATEATAVDFMARAEAGWAAGTDFQYAMGRAGVDGLVGGCGLHARSGPGVLEIGYWVHADHLGRGTATAAARLLTECALSWPAVRRVEIRCDAANAPSAAVARRLGYALAATVPRAPGPPGETHEHLVWVRERP